MSVRLEQRKVDQTITMQTYKVDSMAPCSVRGVRNAIDSDRLPLTSYSLPHPEQTMSWTSKHSAWMALYEAYIARRERRVRLISPKLTKEDGSTWRL